MKDGWKQEEKKERSIIKCVEKTEEGEWEGGEEGNGGDGSCSGREKKKRISDDDDDDDDVWSGFYSTTKALKFMRFAITPSEIDAKNTRHAFFSYFYLIVQPPQITKEHGRTTTARSLYTYKHEMNFKNRIHPFDCIRYFCGAQPVCRPFCTIQTISSHDFFLLWKKSKEL